MKKDNKLENTLHFAAHNNKGIAKPFNSLCYNFNEKD